MLSETVVCEEVDSNIDVVTRGEAASDVISPGMVDCVEDASVVFDSKVVGTIAVD